MLDDIDAGADQTHEEVVAIRNEVEGMRAEVVGVLRAILEAIQNQGGGGVGASSSGKRRSGRIGGGGNAALSQMATGDVDDE